MFGLGDPGSKSIHTLTEIHLRMVTATEQHHLLPMACAYSHKIPGRCSSGPAIAAKPRICAVRAYMGHTMSVAAVRKPPPS